MKSHISPDVFLHVPLPATPATTTDLTTTRENPPPPRIVFFVTGNPGLVAYYHAFLARLSTSNATTEGCIVAGFSLGGFEIEDQVQLQVGDGDGKDERYGGRGEGDSRLDDDLRGLEELQFPGNGPAGGPAGGGGGGPALLLGDDEVRSRKKTSRGKIYSLEEQIVLTETRVSALAERVGEIYGSGGGRGRSAEQQPEVEVVLVGHSVGAYIVLELIHRHRHRRAVAGGQESRMKTRTRMRQSKGVDVDDHHHLLEEEEDAYCGGGGGGGGNGFVISGAVLLTPTISDIAQSRSGRVLAPLTRLVPMLPVLGAAAAKALVAVLPDRWLTGVVGWVAGMDGDAGDGGGGMGPLGATVAFLRSEAGVRQALEMAGEEMRVIREDRWGEEVWGAAAAETETDVESGAGAGATVMDEVAAGMVEEDVRSDGQRRRRRPPKSVFYFAKTDHWVADHTRDALQRLRGRVDGKGQEWKPEMVVDEEDGLVHGWCIRQSGLVAGKVAKWIEDIWRETR